MFVPFEAAQPADQQFKNLRELGAGHYFGEISLLTNLRVTATVFASHYLTCAQIIDKKFLSIVRHSSDFKRNLMVSIGEYKDPIFRNYVEIIRNAFIFKQMNSETLQRISYLFREQRHIKGKVLIRKRERSPYIFFIKKGEVEVRFPYS